MPDNVVSIEFQVLTGQLTQEFAKVNAELAKLSSGGAANFGTMIETWPARVVPWTRAWAKQPRKYKPIRSGST